MRKSKSQQKNVNIINAKKKRGTKKYSGRRGWKRAKKKINFYLIYIERRGKIFMRKKEREREKLCTLRKSFYIEMK